MEDARETRGLNLKLCFRGIRSYGGRGSDQAPAQCRADWAGEVLVASLGDECHRTGRGGPGRCGPMGTPTAPSTRPGPTPGRRVQPVGTGSEGDRLFCRLVPPPTLEALLGACIAFGCRT